MRTFKEMMYGQIQVKTRVPGEHPTYAVYRREGGVVEVANSPDGYAMPDGRNESGNRIWRTAQDVPPTVLALLSLNRRVGGVALATNLGVSIDMEGVDVATLESAGYYLHKGSGLWFRQGQGPVGSPFLAQEN